MKHVALTSLIILAIFLFTGNVTASDAVSEKFTVTSTQSVEAIVAEMSDEKARRLLVETLKQTTAESLAVSNALVDNVGKLAGFVENIKNKVNRVQERIEFLRSGGDAGNHGANSLFASLRKLDADILSMRSILSLLIVFAAAFAVELLFGLYTRQFRGRMISDAPVVLRGKIGRLLLQLCIDVIATLIFIVAAFLFFSLFFEHTHALLIMTAAYLSAIVGVRISLILARFFLSPKDPSSRFLPLSTPAAQYLYRCHAVISFVASFGFLTCGLIRLAGVNEAFHIKAVFMVASLVAFLLIAMILIKRKEMADLLSAKFPDKSLPAKLARKWHHFAIFSVLLFLILSTRSTLLGNSSGDLSFKTMAMVPFYFLMDWALHQILEILFGVIPKNNGPENKEFSGLGKDLMPKQIEFGRIKEITISALRISLAVLFMIWTLNIWGIELSLGKAVAKAVFNILIVVLLCYVFWEFLDSAIQRKMREEMPEAEEEMEEGGAGGSRIGTLLMLFRKFMIVFILCIAIMVILSAMGVNIGPLIAGAGVFGLAIGFGAQTLVKDIISGIFFLVDDAFRVGDYIEVGNSKGMVEHVSLRSFKLRHPRGMINTIPFGDIATITNFSRDYIITKLDFRVRYDTDVEKVRKIIKKKVYKVILENEELGPKLLGKIKSQGVRQMDDSAMIMRVKYKTMPGEQFVIRKEVYRLLQEAFKKEGVEFAHKNVTVYMPPEQSQSSGTDNEKERQERIKAAAAAAAGNDPAEQTP